MTIADFLRTLHSYEECLRAAYYNDCAQYDDGGYYGCYDPEAPSYYEVHKAFVDFVNNSDHPTI